MMIKITIIIANVLAVTTCYAQYSTPYKLNSELVANGNIDFVDAIPGTDQVVYFGDQEVDEMSGIYLTDLDASTTPIRLNSALLSRDAEISSTVISSNGLIATATVDDPGTGGQSFISIPIIGTPLFGITANLALDQFHFSVSNANLNFGIGSEVIASPDGNYLVYRYDSDEDDFLELYSLRLKAGNQPIEISPDMVANGEVIDFSISDDSNTVVYRADQFQNGKVELFSVPIGGGNETKLNTEFGSNQDVFQFEISSDSTTVVYRGSVNNDATRELFSVSIAGGSSTQLNPTPPENGDVNTFKISPDGLGVALLGDVLTNNINELFFVNIDGTGFTKINDTVVNTDGDIDAFEFSYDGLYLVFLGDLITNNRHELFSKPVSGGDQLIISGERPSFGNIEGFKLSSNNRAIFHGVYDTSGSTELYSVPITSLSDRVKLNGDLANLRDVLSNFEITQNGEHVVFLAQEESDGDTDLFSADIITGARQKLTRSDIRTVPVEDFRIAKNGEYILYLSDEETAGKVEAFAVQYEGIPEPVAEQICMPIKTQNGTFAIICF